MKVLYAYKKIALAPLYEREYENYKLFLEELYF